MSDLVAEARYLLHLDREMSADTWRVYVWVSWVEGGTALQVMLFAIDVHMGRVWRSLPVL